jgi:hypothetical protein
MFLLNRSRCDDLHQDCLRQRRHVLCKTTHDGHEKAPVVIVGTPKVDDYADSQLPEEDFTDPRTCRVGKCDLKLSRQTIENSSRKLTGRNRQQKSQ